MSLRHIIAIAPLAIGLGACVAPNTYSTTYAEPPRVVQMGSALSGAQQIPPTASPGAGNAGFNYDRVTGQLTYNINYAGLTGSLQSATLIGPNGAGQNVQIPLPITFTPLAGSATLTPAQGAELLAGRYVVNLATPAYPAGEIRGQVLQGTPVAVAPVVVAPAQTVVVPAQPVTTTVVPAQPAQTITVIQPRQ